MSIERMAFLEISGASGLLDDVLERCLFSGVFHPENAARLSEYSVGTSVSPRNPYGGLLVQVAEIAPDLGIEPVYRDVASLAPGEDREEFVRLAAEALEKLRQSTSSISGEDRERFLSIYSRAKLLHDAFELRRYAVLQRDLFHVVGFVPLREEARFLALFHDLGDQVCVKSVPAGGDSRLETPVRLRNSRFVRPFEMFVTMYGSPSYSDIDPTPFVAYTYSLLFGMMFGDVGQGLLISLLGIYMQKKRGMPLGGILSRIGVSSMIFGGVYGSVFGFEHLLDPVFHAMGFHEKPIEAMRPDMTNLILLTAIGLGVTLILSVMLFNICIGIKRRDYGRILLSHNGVAGLVFYAAALYAGVRTVLGGSAPGTLYILCFFVLPLLGVFFREPIVHLAKLHSADVAIHKSKALAESTTWKPLDTGLRELFSVKFATVRFGRIPTNSYQKLEFYAEEPFALYPIKSDTEYIWCLYAMAVSDKQEIDAIFHDLYFERVFIPPEVLETSEAVEAFIHACIEGESSPTPSPVEAGGAKIAPRRSRLRRVFPDGVGNFILESFFELFEVMLSYVTNTMSFLRVGGFILSHAGMMSVVFTLSGMVSAGASPVVIVLGNLFVMALEGLIVGIQTLRLEFYEMFSRFFDAGGEPYKPVRIAYSKKSA